MLRKSFSASGFVALATVAAVWIGCGSDDPATVPQDDTDGGTSVRRDSGSNTPVDSGSGNGDGTGSLDGGVKITYGTCATATKCGGDLLGTWKITGGCLDKSTFDAARDACPEVVESDVNIQATGTVSFTATETTRDTTQKLTAKVFVPTQSSKSGCPANGQQCSILGFGLTSGIGGPGLSFDKATCTDTMTPSKGCNCTVEKTVADKRTQSYTATGGTMTTSDPTQTFDYCVNGGSSSYIETTSGQSLKLNVTITKQ